MRTMQAHTLAQRPRRPRSKAQTVKVLLAAFVAIIVSLNVLSTAKKPGAPTPRIMATAPPAPPTEPISLQNLTGSLHFEVMRFMRDQCLSVNQEVLANTITTQGGWWLEDPQSVADAYAADAEQQTAATTTPAAVTGGSTSSPTNADAALRVEYEVREGRRSLFRYFVLPFITCLSPDGAIYVDPGATAARLATFMQHTDARVQSFPSNYFFGGPDSDEVLRKAVLLPVTAVMAHGWFVAGNPLRMLEQVVAPLVGLSERLAGGVLRRVPTQAVLLATGTSRWDGAGTRELLERGLELCRSLLNTLSHRIGGHDGWSAPPLVPTAMLFRPNRLQDSSPPNTPVAHGFDGLRCFCNAVAARGRDLYVSGSDAGATQVLQNAAGPALRAVRPLLLKQFAQTPKDNDEGPPTLKCPTAVTESLARSRSHPDGPALRVLFPVPHNRTVADLGRYVAYARTLAGVHADYVEVEGASALEQYCWGLHADVIIGVHGTGLTPLLWAGPSAAPQSSLPNGRHVAGVTAANSVAAPASEAERLQRCVAVIEFLPWASQKLLRPTPFERAATALGLRYTFLSPVDVTYGPSVSDPAETKLVDADIVPPYRCSSWNDQETRYKDEDVFTAFKDTLQRVRECLA